MHTIRLRGAWETVASGGTVCHSRNFGRPRSLDPGQRVWLVCDRLPGPARVSLNGTDLATASHTGPFAADITDRLAPRNVVVFSVSSPDPLGDVALQIRGPGD
jgi:hypothetical protein